MQTTADDEAVPTAGGSALEARPSWAASVLWLTPEAAGRSSRAHGHGALARPGGAARHRGAVHLLAGDLGHVQPAGSPWAPTPSQRHGPYAGLRTYPSRAASRPKMIRGENKEMQSKAPTSQIRLLVGTVPCRSDDTDKKQLTKRPRLYLFNFVLQFSYDL